MAHSADYRMPSSEMIQAVLENHYGTWRADGDPEWSDVAAVVVRGLAADGWAITREALCVRSGGCRG